MGYFIQFTENDQQLFSVDTIGIFEITFLRLDVVFWEKWSRWWDERNRPSNLLEFLNIFQKRVDSFSAFIAIHCWCHVTCLKQKLNSFRPFCYDLRMLAIVWPRLLVWQRLTCSKVINNVSSKCIQSRIQSCRRFIKSLGFTISLDPHANCTTVTKLTRNGHPRITLISFCQKCPFCYRFKSVFIFYPDKSPLRTETDLAMLTRSVSI